jgi:hypothetical protein
MDGAMVNALDTTGQMKRERCFLRIWQDAVDAGELVLPTDSLLVVPRLFEEFDKGSPTYEREEDKLTVLVTEDLVAAGFETAEYLFGINDECAEALALALADFHAACWQIRDRLHRSTGLIPVDTECTADEADAMAITNRRVRVSEMSTGFAEIQRVTEQRLHAGVEQLRSAGDKEGAVVADRVDKYSEAILDALSDREPGLLLYCHNDPWLANVMFRYELDPATKQRGRVNGVAFVDFGSVALGSPVQDFTGFMRTGSNVEMLTEPGTFKENFSSTYVVRLWPQLPQKSRQDMFTIRERAVALAQVLSFFYEPHMWEGSPDRQQRRTRAYSDTAVFAHLRELVVTNKRSESALTPDIAANLIRVRKFQAADATYVDGLVGVKGGTFEADNMRVLAALRRENKVPKSLM